MDMYGYICVYVCGGTHIHISIYLSIYLSICLADRDCPNVVSFLHGSTGSASRGFCPVKVVDTKTAHLKVINNYYSGSWTAIATISLNGSLDLPGPGSPFLGFTV